MDVYDDAMLTVTAAARYLRVSPSTLQRWKDEHIVHAIAPQHRGWPTLPFVGVVETLVLDRLRTMGVPMRHIRDTATAIRERLNDEYGLARPGLSVHGHDILVEVSGDYYRGSDLQQAASETLAGLTRMISWSGKNPQRISLHDFGANVILDPRFGWGQPVIASNKVPIATILGLWLAGESLATVAAEFGLSTDDVEALARADARSRIAA